MNRDTILTWADTHLSIMEGRSPSEAIERQEKRGQAEVVRKQRLPRRLNEQCIPNEVIFSGGDGIPDNVEPGEFVSYNDTRRKVIASNIEAYTSAEYKKMGIEVIDEADDLFWNVKLPEGWEIKATGHSMWNDLIDNKGRKRATFFYKAAFYDRHAFTNLKTRFRLDVDHIADSEDYDVWIASDIQGTVYDGDNVVYQTECVHAPGDYIEEGKINKALLENLEAFMAKHYPNYRDVHAYWD